MTRSRSPRTASSSRRPHAGDNPDAARRAARSAGSRSNTAVRRRPACRACHLLAPGIATFATTFLGHQGWLIRSDRTCLLVDPILCEDFGEAYALGYRVYPPREVDLDAFPAVDALFLSHEHDDHFDIASLARLDRRIPVFLSMHSSVAAFSILREMGFTVEPLVPGVPRAVGDLEVVPFSGDHLSVNSDDEWDALPLMIRHRGGDGSFFTMVDIMMVPGHLEWAKACAPRPGLVTWTNNTLDWGYMAAYLSDVATRDASTEQCLERMDAGHRMLLARWGEPAAMLMCAGGFSFHGDRAWLNERLFGIDTEAVADTLGARFPRERIVSTRPGQTFVMSANRLVRVDERTPFLGTLSRERWPHRGRDARMAVPDYAPASGHRALAAGDVDRLRAALQDYARALVGGILFRSLHSILTVMAGDRRPTFAFVLRREDDANADAALVFEYDANACAFVDGIAEAPQDRYLAVMECWAADLLAVLDGEFGPITLAYGRARFWNAMPQGFRFDPFEAMYRVSHPLARPDAFLRTYRRLWERQRNTRPLVRSNAHEPSRHEPVTTGR